MVKAMKLQLFYHMTKIDCVSSHHEQFNQIINRSNIIITGNNNHVPCISIQKRMLKNYFLMNIFC